MKILPFIPFVKLVLAIDECVADDVTQDLDPFGLDASSPEAFQAGPVAKSLAVKATTPTGFIQVFNNALASNIDPSYMTFFYLNTYDAGLCAALCNFVDGCNAFNVYFERRPTLNPGENCLNPTAFVQAARP
jgi:hypothetical protein